MKTLIFDTEVFGNYFLIGFLNAETGNVRHFEMYPEEAYDENGLHPAPIQAVKLDIVTLRKIFATYRVVSFNGLNYDIPIITVALGGGTNAQIKKVSDRIIVNSMKYWQLDIEPIACDHIDLFNVAPGVASLKIYGGRLHCQRMQDLPFDPADEIDSAKRALLREYCGNDLRTTLDLFRKLEPQIKLREQMGEMYGLELRSKSDAQIAEAVIRKDVEKALHRKLEKIEPSPGDIFGYTPPKWIEFSTEPLNATLDTVCLARFMIDHKGTVKMPDEIANLKIAIGSGVYRMGIGGLHSSEKCTAHYSDDEYVIVDRDVTSYYPAIILNCNLRPRQMGLAFTSVYRSLVEKRLTAKKANDIVTADALKIVCNGSFGKFGSPYSVLYSPTLLIQTTITGQLALLMLIERLEGYGVPVVSANTDGIVVKCPRAMLLIMHDIVEHWEKATGFATEETRYRALLSRDVNNYIALKEDGGFKLKGAYAPAGLQKNPTNEVCIAAVVKELLDGSPVRETVESCRDIRKFVTIRQVKGGALKDGEYLGRAVRWYYAKGETGAIHYKVNNYTVARTGGARPLMELPTEFPDDVDHEWYIREAFEMLSDVGAL